MPTEIMEITQNEISPMGLIQLALSKGSDPEKLKALFDMANRWNADRAAERFADAITAFQKDCPPICKNRKAEAGKMKYAFASLDDIWKIISPVLARYRIAVTFNTEPAEKSLKVTCRVRVGVHFEDSTLTLPIPAGFVNDTQLFGQAVSYGKRYALCSALGIITTDEDNDAANLDYITKEQATQMIRFINESDVPMGPFLAWMQIENVEELPAKSFAKAWKGLKDKANAMKRKEGHANSNV